jgi:lipopolysaccharide transport system permease protein
MDMTDSRPLIADDESQSEQPELPADRPDADSARDDIVIRPTVIRSAGGWQLINVGELWRNRELLFFLIWRDVKVRYKQTLLGAAWAILQPLLMMVVFTVFFGRLAKVPTGNIPYPIFAFTGLLPWTFFSTAITTAGNSVVGSERLITKIYFPRLAIPFAAVGAALVDFCIAFCVLIVMMLGYRIKPNITLLYLPLLVVLLSLASLGVGTLLAALNVAYRDFRYVIPFLTQLWMFATPSVYMQPTHGTGGQFGLAKYLLILNPMTGLVASFRAATLAMPMPWHEFLCSACVVMVLFLAGCIYFRRVEDGFADLI